MPLDESPDAVVSATSAGRNILTLISDLLYLAILLRRAGARPIRARASTYFLALVLVCWSVLAVQSRASAAELVTRLADLSLEELTDIQITSVSKRPEPLSDAAASIFVITSEDIRRSGVRSLPEALRLAPNLQVAQVSASGYAISSRGFSASSANKLLVLIDGRSVYTPLFSGVFWDVQDVMLEDIDASK